MVNLYHARTIISVLRNKEVLVILEKKLKIILLVKLISTMMVSS